MLMICLKCELGYNLGREREWANVYTQSESTVPDLRCMRPRFPACGQWCPFTGSSSIAHLYAFCALCCLFLHVAQISNARHHSFHLLSVALEVLSIGPQNDV